MRKPLFNDPARFGRIPNPPERSEYCHNCRHNIREKQNTFSYLAEHGVRCVDREKLVKDKIEEAKAYYESRAN